MRRDPRDHSIHFVDEGTVNPLLLIGIILLVLWILGFGVFKVAGLLIHILLIVALVMLVMWLLRKGGAKI